MNISNYLDRQIRMSVYKTKKNIHAEMCKRYYGNDEKNYPYSSFSRNIKEGTISLSEGIELSSIIRTIDLNKLAVCLDIYYKKNIKNKINENKESNSMKRQALDLLNKHSVFKGDCKGLTYELDNMVELADDCYYGVYLCEKTNDVALERILITQEDTCIIEGLAYFSGSEFANLLGEAGDSIDTFLKLDLNEKIDVLMNEAEDYREITGDEMKEIEVNI